MVKTVLVVDDEPIVREVVVRYLEREGYRTLEAGDGDAARDALARTSPDLVVLDVMLPGTSGFDLCSLIRDGGRVPVIMLTARDQKADKLKGLEAGADDYITKPFDFDELKARMHAVLRRARRGVLRLLLGDVVIDFQHLRARNARGDIRLTRREFDLLFYLAERRGMIVHRSELLREIWGYPAEPRTRAVDYAIKRLRTKLEADPHNPRYITTVHGDGYSLTFDDADA
jgi:DNA-binding response OmpR family regulator